MTNPRPTLSVCILTRSSQGGLERLIDEIDAVADEIIIGVDASSTDDTFAIASRRADVVFRFEHLGPPVRARLLVLDYARGDWILSLDEDEGLDAAFGPLLPDLLAQARYSHFWFPRKWIVERKPLTYVHGAPWFPDWQLRLFRNDPRRVWHPGIVHSGFRVVGMGCREDRTAILHYEPVTLEPEAREAKIDYYRQHGSEGRSDALYHSTSGPERREVVPGPALASGRRVERRAGHVVPDVVAVPPAPTALPWKAALDVSMPCEAVGGAAVLAEVNARNLGRLAWEPLSHWPILHLSFHVRKADGGVTRFEGDRFALPRVVEPGETARFLIVFDAPQEPGDYVIEWDLVSEGERWFADCGNESARACLHVIA